MKRGFRPRAGFAWRAAVWFLLLALLWHVPLLFSPRKKRRPPPPTAYANREFFIEFQPGIATPVRQQLPLGDPTVFILPSDVGFSAMVRHPSQVLRVDSDVANPPFEARGFQTGREGLEFTSDRALTMNLEGLTEGRESVVVEAPTEEVSAWRVSGGLEGRLMGPGATLPAVISTELLAPTSLRVGVTALGDVAVVALERGSGSDKADEAGIRFVKGLRFAPIETASDGAMVWGFVKILWHAERMGGRP